MHAHTDTNKRGVNPTGKSPRTLGNVNAGGTVTCKLYNLKSIYNLIKKYFIIVF